MDYHAERDDPRANPFPGVFVNPGAGPVAGGTEANAKQNIAAFVEDLGRGAFVLPDGIKWDESEGRCTFRVRYEGKTFEVEMPGLPLENVRYIDPDKQNIWNYPRLYVDGSSWVWFFALGIIQDDE